MKTFLSLHLIIIFSLLHITTSVAQDIHFSQSNMVPLLLNPAQAGALSKMRASISQRTQWKSVASPYSTSFASWDMVIPRKKESSTGVSAYGVTIFYDQAGASQLKTFQANLYYAYHVTLTPHSSLGAGLSGGFMQQQIDFSGLQWMNQYDGTTFNSMLPTGEPTGSNSLSNFDVGAGLHYSYKEGERYMSANDQTRFDAGIAVQHLNRPKNSFYNTGERLDMRITGYVGGLFGLNNSRYSLVPRIVYMQQSSHSQILLGTLLRYEIKENSRYTSFEKASAFSVGVHYRNQDAVIVSMLYEFSRFSLGLSYDATTSSLKGANGRPAAFEVSLSFLNPNPFGNRAP